MGGGLYGMGRVTMMHHKHLVLLTAGVASEPETHVKLAINPNHIVAVIDAEQGKTGCFVVAGGEANKVIESYDTVLRMWTEILGEPE